MRAMMLVHSDVEHSTNSLTYSVEWIGHHRQAVIGRQ